MSTTDFEVNYAIEPLNPYPAGFAGTGPGVNWVSGKLPFTGVAVTLAAQLSRNGLLVLDFFADAAGQLQIGSAATAPLTANTPGYVTAHRGQAALYFEATIVNTSANPSTLTHAAIVVSGAA